MHVVGARPNFMKVAPVMATLSKRDRVSQTLVHTGQHYDSNMSEIFFRQLEIPEPDINLGIGSGSHAQQTAQIISRFEYVVLEKKPDLVLVYGDVNSTVAAALVCVKLLIPVGHVEAGLRSFDRTMPEEINRLLTDQISELLFTPSSDGDKNLLLEGIAPEKIHRVGNVMIDTLIRLKKISSFLERFPGIVEKRLELSDSILDRYALVTIHRPSNVDHQGALASIMTALNDISNDIPIIFPIHPRTRKRLQNIDFKITNQNFFLTKPFGYLDFLALQERANLIITDSGGIQEETTFLGVPCLTVRENTERPITVKKGTNILVGKNMEKLKAETRRILNGKGKKGSVPELWDGEASERIAEVIMRKAF
jgi:UDP-N-acetylglucosamine 2-epimerase (non-hydrolysing)